MFNSIKELVRVPSDGIKYVRRDQVRAECIDLKKMLYAKKDFTHMTQYTALSWGNALLLPEVVKSVTHNAFDTKQQGKFVPLGSWILVT